MLLTLSYSEAIFPSHKIASIGRMITAAFLDWTENAVIASRVTMKFQEFPDGYTLVGGDIAVGAWLECKLPAFLLTTRSHKDGFFEDATEILLFYSGGRLKRRQVYTNAVHSVDGACGHDGNPLTGKNFEAARTLGSTSSRNHWGIDAKGRSSTAKKPSPTLQDAINHPLYYL